MSLRPSLFVLPMLLAGTIGLLACSSAQGPGQVSTAVGPDLVVDADGHPAGLHHYHKWSERLGQGAQPGGDVAFANLAAMGYTTVLSVDGARPDVAGAERHGLRYVHVPIGYEGIRKVEALQIVKAVEISEGPVYVHCHHGLHRGPAGAMVARIAIDGISNEQALVELRDSGCNPKYEGLYTDIGKYTAPTADELAAVSADLPAVVEPDGFIDSMISVSYTYDNLKAARAAGWQVPPDSPDVSPPHEARMLWEHYREAQRLDDVRQDFDGRFIGLLRTAEANAVALETALRHEDTAAAEAAFGVVKQDCSNCHETYRDGRERQ